MNTYVDHHHEAKPHAPSEIEFSGQQEGERVLYEVHPHHISFAIAMMKIGGISAIIFLMLTAVSFAFPMMTFLAIILPLIILIVGYWVNHGIHDKTVAYITDRRVVRFEATTPFHVGNRTLSFDDVTKIKTYGSGMIEGMANVGVVVFKARTTLVKGGMEQPTTEFVDDDIQLNHVYYYKDLGNYLDKLLYLYKHDREELKKLRRFVAKSRGNRY